MMAKTCGCHADESKPNKLSQNSGDHTESNEVPHEKDNSTLQLFLPIGASLVLLIIGLCLDHWIKPSWFQGWLRFSLYGLAYLPVGLPVIKEAIESIREGDWFSEFFLMALATIGAFAIGQYPEAVGVMLFYGIGEIFQDLAVQRAKGNIQSLLDQRPDELTILQDNMPLKLKAGQAQIGQVIQLKPGEKLALDGVLISESASFNTAALTGESKPDTKYQGETVLAGMINLQQISQVQITTAYQDSKLSKILALVQNATSQKAKTELFIRKFARVYTPVVVLLALLIMGLPYLFVTDYQFSTWLYRALIFLVISCPCALVISIPLGYFGGIGAGSRHGILFKGSNFLDTLAHIQNVVMDKTGTLTEGVFQVQQVDIAPHFNQAMILDYLNAVESKSTHPIATAIQGYIGAIYPNIVVSELEEIAGHGIAATVDGHKFLAGNTKLLGKFDIRYPAQIRDISDTVITMALDGQYVGYVTIADNIKADAKQAVQGLHQLGIKTTMLSGDKSDVVANIARQLGIDQYYGDLLPDDKVNHVKAIKAQPTTVAFVGDGVNDAPVIALSDVGIAMGGLGSDATIETADVVIQDDKPSKIALAVQIGKQTRKIVWQNIILAFSVKAVVLLLGALGMATMWEAVFADVGVALLAILNAVRIQNMRFNI